MTVRTCERGVGAVEEEEWEEAASSKRAGFGETLFTLMTVTQNDTYVHTFSLL